MLVLDIHLGAQCVQSDIPVYGTLTIGRDSSNSVIIADRSLSRRHARLCVGYSAGEATVTLEDEGSTNGTFVNGKRITSRVVGFDDSILVGRCRLTLREGASTLLPGVKDDEGQTIVFTGNPFGNAGIYSQRLEVLHGLAQTLHELDVSEILDRVCAAVRLCVSFDAFCVVLVENGYVTLRNTWDGSGPCDAGDVAISQTVVRACLRDAQPVLSGNLRSDQRFCGVDSVAIKRLGSALCVPLLSDDGVLGVLYCSSQSTKKAYSQEDLQFLMLVASNVAVAIRHERSLSRSRIEANKRAAVLDSLREVVLFCDAHFRVVAANRAASKVFDEDSLVDRRLEEVFAAAGFSHDFEPMATIVHKAFYLERESEGESSYKVERMESYHGTISPISGLEDESWEHIVCLRDVTNAQRSEKMREVFAYQLAHKLNTPLTVVLSSCTFLEERIRALSERLGEQLDEESTELLEMGRKNLQEMNDLVERFVQLSETEIGKAGIEAHQEVAKVASLVSQALDFVSSDLGESGMEVQNHTESVGVLLVVNIEKITECFLQIIQNAAKFSGRGSKLVIDCQLDDFGLEVTFTDNGPGLSREHQGDVFRIFHQIDPEDTGSVPGLGLGLWWAREVLQVHGGDVTIESPVAEGRGTRVRFKFPASLVVRAEERAMQRDEDKTTTTDLSPGQVEMELA